MLLLDSDILIDALRIYAPALNWLSGAANQQIAVPGYVAMELIGGCKDRKEQRVVENLIQGFEIIWMSSEECSYTLDLFKQYRLSHHIGLIDVLIAQTAISRDLPLHTFNVKHFSCIPQLKIVQPYKK